MVQQALIKHRKNNHFLFLISSEKVITGRKYQQTNSSPQKPDTIIHMSIFQMWGWVIRPQK